MLDPKGVSVMYIENVTFSNQENQVFQGLKSTTTQNTS